MRKNILIAFLYLAVIFLTASICIFFTRGKNIKHQERISEILIENEDLKSLISQQSKYSFSKANSELVLHSYLKKKPIAPLSELIHNKSYIFYLISENTCNPCVSDLNEKVLLALNELDKSLFFIVGTKNHIKDQSNIIEYLNLDLKENLLITFGSFFMNIIEDNATLMLFTMDESLRCNNLFIIHDSNIHLVNEFLSNGCSSLKNANLSPLSNS